MAQNMAQNDPQRRTIAISGASGLVGAALIASLPSSEWTIRKLVRKPVAGEILWNYETRQLDASQLESIDGVVHLAGENIAAGRWNDARKKKIRDSRVLGTRFLCETLAKLSSKPKVLVAASAIGFYGDRQDALLDEQQHAGKGFLSDTCAEWESATRPAVDAGIRVVNLRIGIVLSRHGGALQKMLLPFKLGLGGNVGSGGQYWSWIALPDLVNIIRFALTHESLRGPVNAVAPQSVTNAEFTRTLGRVLHRPTIFPMPGFAARMAFGEMANELMLASTRVAPLQLQETGYSFLYPHLTDALRNAIYE